MSELAKVFYDNALGLLRQERRTSSRVNAAYRTLQKNHIEAGAVEWLANPFVRTALSILQSLSGNYKVREAIKLLKEAGSEAEAESKKKKAAPTKKWR
jgi:hypothetical protein